MHAESGEKLGELLFNLVEWMISPPQIDLTQEEVEGMFMPPTDTTVNGRVLLDPLVLIEERTMYSW